MEYLKSLQEYITEEHEAIAAYNYLAKMINEAQQIKDFHYEQEYSKHVPKSLERVETAKAELAKALHCFINQKK